MVAIAPILAMAIPALKFLAKKLLPIIGTKLTEAAIGSIFKKRGKGISGGNVNTILKAVKDVNLPVLKEFMSAPVAESVATAMLGIKKKPKRSTGKSIAYPSRPAGGRIKRKTGGRIAPKPKKPKQPVVFKLKYVPS